ncbi:MAG TPA: radical SAM protein [Dehalococcoidales bacterium]|nr:radical SAM protein [Dehalococcoidales bacterium]
MNSAAVAAYTEEIGVLGRKKTELQTHGVIVPAELQDELGREWNAPAIKNGRFVLCLESPEGGRLTTVLVINGKFAEKSPFHLVKTGPGRFEVWKGGEKYTEIVLLPRPGFYDSFTTDGIRMSDVAVIGEPDHLRSVLNQRCGYQRIGRACKFCAVESWWAGYTEKTPSHVAEVAAAAYREGVARHITLSTGTRLSPGKGLEDLVATARLIQKQASLTMTLNFEPLNDYALLESLLRAGKGAGATTALCNIECFDEGLREDIMPMKGRNTIDDYLRVWGSCVDIFDRNEVYTMVIAGLGESDESILRGVELAASVGVVASIVPHTPMRKAVYEDMAPPGVERMLRLYAAALPIYERYGLKLYGGTGGIFTSMKGM